MKILCTCFILPRTRLYSTTDVYVQESMLLIDLVDNVLVDAVGNFFHLFSYGIEY